MRASALGESTQAELQEFLNHFKGNSCKSRKLVFLRRYGGFEEMRGIDEVLEFEDIPQSVIKKVEPNKNYRDSEFLQTERLLKAYGFLGL